VGDLTKVKLKRGRQELLKRLEQALAITSAPPAASAGPIPAPPAVPASDPAAAFAAAARQHLGPRVVRCDETWLPGSDTPVLVAVVQGSATEQRPQLETLFNDTLWRGPRPPLHVLDTSAWETLQALAAAGLLTLHARATRPLLAAGDGAPPPPPLTAGEAARIQTLVTLMRRKARAACALLAADLADEALPSLREAAFVHAQAAALRRRLPEPATLRETLSPPHDATWPADGCAAIHALDGDTIAAPAAATFAEWLLQAQP
jgi:hypothetical protein